MQLVALLGLAFAIGLIVWAIGIVADITRRSAATDLTLEEDSDSARLGELAERKEMAMHLMLSTELDHQTGKISDDDRERTLGRLKREAVGLMREIDALGGTEHDVERARVELDEFLAVSRATQGDRSWSAAARVRHGGQRPTEAT